MKYFYNGKLIRTSKAHKYTHAVINVHTLKVIGCRGTKENAESLLNSEINRIEKDIDNYKNKLNSYKAGKTKYGWKDGGKTWYENFKPTDSEDSIKKSITWCENYLEEYKNNHKVVELEER